MTFVALALAVALSLSVLGFTGLLRAVLRQQARERDLLINQIMHLAGRTWAPPPSEEEIAEGEEILDDFIERFQTTPQQLPDF